ncbi:MAG: hypothetical protein DRP84_00540 [Spirochaetes bacterium]|nr:MAG: hypothetical protein DRP84_00540 [Spirochaetota bacterium]
MKMDGKPKLFLIAFFVVFILSVLIAAPSISSAEKVVKIYSSVDENQIGINQTLTLSVTIETKNISKVLEPSIPDISPFKVVSKNSSTSTEISFINGKTSRVKKYRYKYTLKPGKIGKFLISPISVTYKGKEYKTDPIVITVTEKNIEREYITDEGLKIDPIQLKKEIFVKAKINKQTAYVGEQLSLRYEIFSTHEIEQISIISMPKMEGFYRIDIENPSRLKYNNLYSKGKNYKHSVIKKLVLYPLYPGNFNISPIETKVTALIRNREFPNLFALPYTLILKTPELAVKVIPLPEYNGKYSFTGIVGKLQVDVAQHSKSIYQGESSRFYITVKSNGNLNNIKDIHFSHPENCKIILSDIYNDKKLLNGTYYFSKKFEYTIIPEKNGKLVVKAEKLLYFDTDKKSYVSLNIKPLYFDVNPVPTSENINTETEKTTVEDKDIKSKYKNLLFIVISSFSILTAILVYLLFKTKKSNFRNHEINKNKSETNENLRNIRLLMAEAESKLLNDNVAEASSLIKRAITYALSARLGISSGKVTIKNIEKSNLDEALKEELKNSLSILNKIIYSPEKEDLIKNKGLLSVNIEKFESLIKRLEDDSFSQ